MCEDCAFRPNSPERQGLDGYENNDGGERLAELVDKGEPFYCHQGCARSSSGVIPSALRSTATLEATTHPSLSGR
jgi:hypothetical protein